MEKNLDIMGVIFRLREAAAEGAIPPDVMKGEELEFRFISANIHLNSLITFAAMCDTSIATGSLSDEMVDLMRRISDSMHIIAYGLDEAISRIAELSGYEGWPPIFDFEKMLTENVEKGEPMPNPPQPQRLKKKAET